MGDPSQPDRSSALAPRARATPLMRVALGAATATFASCTAVPVAVVLATLFSLGLSCGAAIALHHVGALESVHTFRLAHWFAVWPLGIFLVAAYAFRFFRRDARGTLAFVLRWPLLVTCVALPFATLVLLRLAWDTTLLGPVSGAITLADLYFFSLATFLGMLYVTVRVSRAAYSWAAVSQYRAGLVTGALVTTLSVLFSVGYRSTPGTPDRAATGDLWTDRVAAVREPDALETERQALRELDEVIEPARAALDEGRSAPGARLAPPPRGTELAQSPPFASDGDPVNDCIRLLQTDEVPQVQRTLQRRYGLSDDDAHDIVYDAMMNVCESHVRKAYSKLGAVLQTAAGRRASRWISGRRRECPVDPETPSCMPSADESVRFAQEDSVLDDALCREDGVTQQIVRMRGAEDKDFATIGRAVGMTADEARTKWNNARRRMRKRLTDRCGS